MVSFETSDLKLTTSLVLFENNENNIPLISGSSSRGLFITPRSGVDVTGYLVISSNEQGKLQFINPAEFLSIDDLSDVSINEPLLDNQVLQYDTVKKWTNKTLVFPSLSLNELFDVTITNPLNNDILRYSTDTWNNEQIPTADTETAGFIEIASQTDVENDVGGDGVIDCDTMNNIMNNLNRIVNIELVESATASNSPTLELTWTQNSNFQNYLITVHNIVPVDLNTGYLSLRVSQDGGASWESNPTDYRSRFQKNATVSITAPSNDRTYLHGKIFGGINDATIAGPFSGNYMLLSPDSTRIKKIFGMSRFTDFLSGKETMLYVGAFVGNSQSINGLQFEFASSSTNIASGSVYLYRF